MVLLENDPFLTELGKFYAKTKTSGTVYITFKRVIEATLAKVRLLLKRNVTLWFEREFLLSELKLDRILKDGL